MAKINSHRHDIYDVKPFPVGKASMLTVFFLIIFLVIGSLLLGGFFMSDRNGSNPTGNSSRQANS